MSDRAQVALDILDRMSQFTALVDTDGRVLEVNRAALERIGLEREQVLGRPFWEMAWWRSGLNKTDGLRSAILRTAAGEPILGKVEVDSAGDNGEGDVIAFWLTPVRDDSGRVESVLVEGRPVAPRETARAGPAPEPGRSQSETQAAPPAEAIAGPGPPLVALTELLPIFVWTARADGFLTYANDHWRVYTGRPCDEALGWGWTSALHPDDMGRCRERWERAVAEVRPYVIEQRVRRADGVSVWHTALGVPILDAAGRVTGWVGATIEIDDRKRAEEALQAREEQLRLALEAAHMSAWDHNLSTDRITLSVSEKSLFGDEAGTYDYGELNKRIHPEDREEYVRARRERAAISREARFVLPDGSIRWVWTQGRFIHNEAGEAVRALGVTMDITDRKSAEDALRRSEWRYHFLFETMAQGVIYQDAGGAIIDLNPAAERILGVSSVELKGQTSVDREPYCIRADGSPFPGSEHPAMVSLQTGQITRNVLMGVQDLRSGDDRWIDITAVPLFRDGDERPHQVCSLFDEITERKRAEDALRSSERQFRSIFLASRDTIVIADDEGRYTDANPAAGELFGLPRDQLVGRHGAEFIDPSIDFPTAWAEFRRTGGSRGIFRLIRLDGTVREVEHSSTLNFLPGRHMAILHDVTDRNRAEAALRRYATRLMSLREIDQAILTIQPPEKIARVALRHLSRIVPCWHASVVWIDPVAKQERFLTAIGALSRRMPPGMEAPPLVIAPEDLRSLKRGGSLIVDDLHEQASLSKRLELLKEEGARSVACLPLLVRGRLIGSINFFSDRPRAYMSENVEVIREAADQVAIALHNAGLYEENRLARERLEVLSRRIIHAQEDERRQIARELHDEIGQAMTSVKINLQGLVNQAAGQDERAIECIAIVDDALNRVRGMALDLRPALLDDLGLVAALQWYVERHARRTNLEGRFIADPEDLRAAPEVETACFRVAQEALTNIARHARASRFSVELLQLNHGLELIVRDDGCGFDPAEAMVRAAGGASLGLVGMNERVELVGGKVAFVSAPGKGTEVQVSIPGGTPVSPRASRPGSGR
ncbi:MAG: PAS domain S-box protein [Isosphaeraceae bacterium]